MQANIKSHSVRRISYLAHELGIQSYLEIGVSKGRTLFNVDIANKTAVDPSFRFDVAEAQKTHRNISFHEATSDEFFSGLSQKNKYDLIFLDGLHTFEQTYRDLCNCLIHANERTVILIDDVKPNDVFSAIRDKKKAYKRRSETGNDSKAWHGDVFKVIFALHDFHPSLNYRTMLGSENSQTLLWRSKLGWRQPLLNSLEAISRLTYFELLDHIAILRGCSEEEAMAACLSELHNSNETDTE